MGYSFFLDLDGTLLSSPSGRFSDRTLSVLTRLQQEGNKIYLNTGRPAGFLPVDAFRGFRFDGYLCGCSYINCGGKLILDDLLGADLSEPIVMHFYGRNIPVLLEGEEAVWAAYDTDGSTGFIPVNDPSEIFRICELERITKLNILSLLPEEDLNFIREFADPIVRGDANCTEVVRKGNSKGTALQLVVNAFDLDPNKTVAIGDTSNDIPMFEAAAYSVAMGNALPEIQAKAESVTLSCEEDGAAAAMEAFLK